MKVLLVNGSPRENGSTMTALAEIEKTLRAEGAETEIIQIGKEPVRACTQCLACQKLDGRCAFSGDPVNEILSKAEACDGFIFASPVYYAAASGALMSVLGRVFYAGGKYFPGKPGAAVVCARRAGTTSALGDIQKFFPINGMPTVPSQYWPMVFGRNPGDAEHDGEGLQIMRTLARNMVWMIRCIEAGKAAGITYPAPEQTRERTNFIR